MRSAVLSGAIALLGNSLGPLPAVSVGDGIELANVPGKGIGAFATRDLPAGMFLGCYSGKLMSAEAAADAARRGETSGAYFARMQGVPGSPLVIDSEDASTSTWPRYINHSRRRKNCLSLELQYRVSLGGLELGALPLGLYVKTSRPIAAGEELLMDYGDEYWTSRGYTSFDPRRIVIDNF